MLTAAHRVYHWDRRTSSISSDRLADDTPPLVLAPALAVYRAGLGGTRGRVRNACSCAICCHASAFSPRRRRLTSVMPWITVAMQ